jgi:peptide/nickel transport system substrate-binding protein
MEEQPSKLRDVFTKKRELAFFEGIGDYIRSRSAGDQFIFVLLGLLIIGTSLTGILRLQSYIMVTEPAYGGSLTEGDVGSPRFVNPLLALSTTDQDLTALTYAGLMGENGNGSPVPVLAQSYIVSPDGKTYQFTLRDNSKFSDGSPITANDVVYTVQKAQDAELKSPQQSNWTGVQVTALDSHTVQFTLPAPYAQFLYTATLGIMPAHLWQNVTDDEFPFSSLETTPVGDGPFVVTHVNRDSSGAISSYALSANRYYALGRPYLDSFYFTFYPDQASLQTALTNNDVQSAYGIVSKNALKAPYSHIFAVFFNTAGTDGSDLSKIATRQALSVGIDRDAIVKNVLSGYATAINGPVPVSNGVSPVALPDSATRIADATTLLQQAGFSKSNPLSITLTTSNVPELQVLAQSIQSDWEQIGVQTNLQLVQPGDLPQKVIQSRQFQALLFGMVIGKNNDLYDFWDSKESAFPGLNITNYSNPSVDALLSDLRTQTDPSTRTKDLSQINQLISADYPAAFIESPDFLYSVPNNLKGVILPEITAPSDRFATVATWYRRTESVLPFLARPKS